LFGLVNRCAKTRIGVRIAAADAGSNRKLFDAFGKNLTTLGILRRLYDA